KRTLFHEVSMTTPIKNRIRSLGLSQRFLADHLGISEPRMSDIANGRYVPPDPDTRRKLAKLLTCPQKSLWSPETILAAV
ncbi:helix-turn-helix transcriptional regulator, partial [bacterium]|nr:helix-turn-helix transcriptional regulator [bacterium]